MNAEQLSILNASVERLRVDACKLHEYLSEMLFADTSSEAIKVRTSLHNAISHCNETLRGLKELSNGS